MTVTSTKSCDCDSPKPDKCFAARWQGFDCVCVCHRGQSGDGSVLGPFVVKVLGMEVLP